MQQAWLGEQSFRKMLIGSTKACVSQHNQFFSWRLKFQTRILVIDSIKLTMAKKKKHLRQQIGAYPT
jgi:hypothetical protein